MEALDNVLWTPTYAGGCGCGCAKQQAGCVAWGIFSFSLYYCVMRRIPWTKAVVVVCQFNMRQPDISFPPNTVPYYLYSTAQESQPPMAQGR
jgi:hypothetical protein